jgi:hypothetical protein
MPLKNKQGIINLGGQMEKGSVKSIMLLRRVDEDEAFWLCSNVTVQSLEELAFHLMRVDDAVFRYHIQRSRNDFEDWIRECIGDRELAREIARVKTKDTLAKKIEARIEELKKQNSIKEKVTFRSSLRKLTRIDRKS